jgi:predicted ATP-binding protein involved in virulence
MLAPPLCSTWKEKKIAKIKHSHLFVKSELKKIPLLQLSFFLKFWLALYTVIAGARAALNFFFGLRVKMS